MLHWNTLFNIDQRRVVCELLNKLMFN
jgi:hypothetical protein